MSKCWTDRQTDYSKATVATLPSPNNRYDLSNIRVMKYDGDSPGGVLESEKYVFIYFKFIHPHHFVIFMHYDMFDMLIYQFRYLD